MRSWTENQAPPSTKVMCLNFLLRLKRDKVAVWYREIGLESCNRLLW